MDEAQATSNVQFCIIQTQQVPQGWGRGVTLQGWLGLALRVVAIGGDFRASNLSCVVIYQGLGSEFWSMGWPVRAWHYPCVFEKTWLVEQF